MVWVWPASFALPRRWCALLPVLLVLGSCPLTCGDAYHANTQPHIATATHSHSHIHIHSHGHKGNHASASQPPSNGAYSSSVHSNVQRHAWQSTSVRADDAPDPHCAWHRPCWQCRLHCHCAHPPPLKYHPPHHHHRACQRLPVAGPSLPLSHHPYGAGRVSHPRPAVWVCGTPVAPAVATGLAAAPLASPHPPAPSPRFPPGCPPTAGQCPGSPAHRAVHCHRLPRWQRRRSRRRHWR